MKKQELESRIIEMQSVKVLIDLVYNHMDDITPDDIKELIIIIRDRFIDQYEKLKKTFYED